MTDYVIYHNPRCSKSRQTLALLEEQGIEPTVRLYLNDVPSKEELLQVLQLLEMTPRDLLRKKENDFKELNLSNQDFSDDQILEAMISRPKLIERPVVVIGDHAVLGRPPENVLDLI